MDFSHVPKKKIARFSEISLVLSFLAGGHTKRYWINLPASTDNQHLLHGKIWHLINGSAGYFTFSSSFEHFMRIINESAVQSELFNLNVRKKMRKIFWLMVMIAALEMRNMKLLSCCDTHKFRLKTGRRTKQKKKKKTGQFFLISNFI